MSDPEADFAAALALPAGQPQVGFAALHRLAEALVGAKIFTVLAVDLTRRQTRRVFTSDKGLYPDGAVDPLSDSIWEQTVIEARRPLLLNDRAALASLLPEVDRLVERGCEAMLNLPVVVAGEVLGVLNMLHDSGRYDAARVTRAGTLLPGAAALLLWGGRR